MHILMRESWFISHDEQLTLLRGGQLYDVPMRLGTRLLQARRAKRIPDSYSRSDVMMNAFPNRRVVRTAAPSVEPVSLSEAKSFLRIDGSDEDALLTDLIAAARIAAEEQTGKSFLSQSWQVIYNDCPPPVAVLPYGPVQGITSVKSIADDSGETVVDAGKYHLNAVQELVFETVPSGHQIIIEYVAGYGASAADVPTDLAQAILLHVAQLYEHRDTMRPPLASALMYAAHREIRL